MKNAISVLNDSRISLKDSITICREINGKRLSNAKKLVEGLANGKREIGGKHYTNTAAKVLEILQTIEANAKVKGMDEKKLYISKAKADKGFRFRRPRSRWKARGQKVKSASIRIEVGER